MKIDFFIAGFQKSATTKLKDLISRNSNVTMHKVEEMTYFIDEEYKSCSYDFISEYFEDLNEEKTLGAKNVSMAVSENSLKRLKDHNPACKLIFVLRNPIKRAYSAYWYCRRMGWENVDSFEAAIEKPLEDYPTGIVRRNCDYIGQSYYAKHLAMAQRYFPREQIKVYILEEDFRDMDSLNIDLCSFLKIPVERFSQDVNISTVNTSAMPRFKALTRILKSKSNISTCVKKIMPSFIIKKVKRLKEHIVKFNEIDFAPPAIPEEAYKKLEAIFNKKNQELESLLDRDLSVWCR